MRTSFFTPLRLKECYWTAQKAQALVVDARDSGVVPRVRFEREEFLARCQANCLNILKACMMQLADEFELAGQSPASQCCSTPKIENLHPQAPSLTTCDQQEKATRLDEPPDMLE